MAFQDSVITQIPGGLNLSRLQQILVQSKTQSDNPALYQTIYGLIKQAQAQMNITQGNVANLDNKIISGGAGITQLTGDVTAGPGTGSQVATIGNKKVTYAKIQDVSAASELLGRGSAAGAGTVQEITLGIGLSMSGTVLASSGGSSRQFWQFKAKTSATSGYPGDGYILWDNATQTSATHLLFAHLTSDDVDIDLFLAFITTNDTIFLQDQNASANFQKWTVTGAPVNTNGGTATSYWTVPVTLVTSGGTGTTGFPNNHQLVAAIFPPTSGGITQLTGDVTAGPGTGSQAATIANKAVTYAKIQDISATKRLLGRNSAGSGVTEEVTISQALDWL